VKRSRDQSTELPSRRIFAALIVPPDSLAPLPDALEECPRPMSARERPRR
jgi:hypothetical protein